MRHRGLIRNFESVLECLVDRGHEVVLALGTMPTRWLGDSDPLHHPFVERCEGIEVRAAPAGGGAAATLSRRLRLALDYLRYLEPEYADAPKLRARARGKAP